jgi:hypothetical protein
VGAATGQEVQVLGIRLLDPVALWRQPVLLHGYGACRTPGRTQYGAWHRGVRLDRARWSGAERAGARRSAIRSV